MRASFLIIILAAGVLFTFEWVPADVTALGILVLLVVLCLLPDEEAFSGFGSETVLMIFGLFVLTAALLRTGVVDIARRKVLQYSSDNPNRLLNVIIWVSAILGASISNIASTAFFLPIVMGAAKRIGVAASTSYLTPLEPACLLVYGPGGYRFYDFLKVGSLLTILIYIIAIVLVPIFWPLS